MHSWLLYNILYLWCEDGFIFDETYSAWIHLDVDVIFVEIESDLIASDLLESWLQNVFKTPMNIGLI